MNPLFLTVDQVVPIHRSQLEKDGGLAGIRDRNLLESAAMQAMATFDGEFLHEDLHPMAAAYCYHIVKNHPFIDANKRAGLMAALAFSRINGILVLDPRGELYQTTMSVAEGVLGKSELAIILRRLGTPST